MEIKTTQRIALQLVGSPTSLFFFDLSMLYAKAVVQPPGFTLLFAVVYPDGSWAVCNDLNHPGPRLSLSEIIGLVQQADLVVPHLFCPAGLTSWRTFFEKVLGLPLVGSSGQVLQMAQNKQLTKLLAQDAGVRVPQGHRVTAATWKDLSLDALVFPLIVKPNSSDNSDGLTLVYTPDALAPAIQQALRFDSAILLEEFVAGRELRGAILEEDGQYHTLPFIEYGVSEAQPIRRREDKYQFGPNGALLGQSEKLQVPAQCPATVDTALQIELTQMMVALHQRLGCRDFSMYDFRIHHLTGQPYLLEAGLFWSFSPASMISDMLQAQGRDLTTTTEALWTQRL